MQVLSTGPGTCTFYGNAKTRQTRCWMEVMGACTWPGARFVHSENDGCWREPLNGAAGRRDARFGHRRKKEGRTE